MTWRLILDGEYLGAWNMARDEALLLSPSVQMQPVMRFYGWNPATVSIGRLQKDSSFIVQNSSLPFIRRPTGGRAVWHQHEITYCAVIPQAMLPRESRSVIGAYQWLSNGFLRGLETLGVRATLSSERAMRGGADNCFASSAQCDFVVDERKLIGAAQCRQNDVILQHGSLLLEVDREAWENAVGGEMRDAISLAELGVLAPREEIVAALCEGMAQTWNISWEKGGLTQEELDLASRLHQRKYSCPEWNLSGKV